jgi:hypothetical protein
LVFQFTQNLFQDEDSGLEEAMFTAARAFDQETSVEDGILDTDAESEQSTVYFCELAKKTESFGICF